MQPPDDPFTGTPYRGLRLLGEGAQGTVWEAEHRQLRKVVAIKLLHAHLRDSVVLTDRMRMEAQILAACDSPHLVNVLDLATLPGGAVYFVMERLDGSSLKDALAREGPIAAAEAVELTQQLLRGLSAAHAAGLVHRDVKPGNIHLCPQTKGGRLVKLLDFGVAKVIEQAELSPAIAPLIIPTATGKVAGTPRYMAPEQILGQRLDGRSDLYSAALVLYEMLAGRGPFHHHDTLAELLVAHATEAPAPPSAYAHQPIGPALEHVILRALSKEPAERYRNAEELGAALRLALQPAAATMPIDRFEAVAHGPTAPVLALTEPMPPGARPLVEAASRQATGRARSPAPAPRPVAAPPRVAAYALFAVMATLLLVVVILLLSR